MNTGAPTVNRGEIVSMYAGLKRLDGRGGVQSEIVGEAASCSVVVQTSKSGMVWRLVLSKELKEDLISESRNSDSVMNIELGLEEMVVNIMCACAPQVGCTENEKETLW